VSFGGYGGHEGSAFITGPLLFQLDQDEPAQVGKDREMNELEEFENDVLESGERVKWGFQGGCSICRPVML